MVSPTLVIYNPAAGRGRVQMQWSQVEQTLRASGIDFEAVATRAPLDAMRLASSRLGRSHWRARPPQSWLPAA